MHPSKPKFYNSLLSYEIKNNKSPRAKEMVNDNTKKIRVMNHIMRSAIAVIFNFNGSPPYNS